VPDPARSTTTGDFVVGGRTGVLLGADAAGRGLLAGSVFTGAGGGEGGGESDAAGGGEGAGGGDVTLELWLAASGAAGVWRVPGAGSGFGAEVDALGLNGSGLGCWPGWELAGAAPSAATAATAPSAQATRTRRFLCVESAGPHWPPRRGRAR
jgi:hypothetical protein